MCLALLLWWLTAPRYQIEVSKWTGDDYLTTKWRGCEWNRLNVQAEVDALNRASRDQDWGETYTVSKCQD